MAAGLTMNGNGNGHANGSVVKGEKGTMNVKVKICVVC